MEIPVSLEILIVEDNELHRELIVRMLELVGYSADVVNGGEEALVAIEQKDYSLILMDLAMPRLDGFATTQQIRSNPVSDPYIIAVTALNMDNPKEQCLHAGMDDILQKPVLIDDFRAALARFYTSQFN